MKIAYKRPINDENIEDVSLSIEKGIEKVRQAKTLDYIASPICFILNIIFLPIIAILIIESTEFNDFIKPLNNMDVFSKLMDIADDFSISMLGSAVHPAIIMVIIAVVIPLVICWPITFIVSKFIAHKCVSPLEGETNRVVKANIICDQVEKLRFARAEGTKMLFNHLALIISIGLYVALVFYDLNNLPKLVDSISSFAFVAVIAGLAYALISYAVIYFSKSIVITACGLNPIYYVKELKKDAMAYKISVHLPSIIKNAIRDDLFFMNYQPIYWSNEDKFGSIEALCRLNNPIFGFIPPDVFIKCAEETDQISELTNLIVHKVCKFIINSQCRVLGINYVTINLSVIDMMKRHRIDHIVSIIDNYGIPHYAIGFEITETVSESSTEDFWRNADYLANQGFKILMDDFGTGYSSLSRMIQDAFSVVKIDRTLIADRKSKEKETLLRDIVNMLKHLNKEIVMEGVETKEHVDLMRELGVDHIQGYFYSKPLDENTLMDFIRATRESKYN